MATFTEVASTLAANEARLTTVVWNVRASVPSPPLIVRAPVVLCPNVSPRSAIMIVSFPAPPLMMIPFVGLNAASRSVNVSKVPVSLRLTVRLLVGFAMFMLKPSVVVTRNHPSFSPPTPS